MTLSILKIEELFQEPLEQWKNFKQRKSIVLPLIKPKSTNELLNCPRPHALVTKTTRISGWFVEMFFVATVSTVTKRLNLSEAGLPKLVFVFPF